MPVSRLDTETALLMAVPLLRPPASLSGTCKIVAEFPDGGSRRLAGVTVEMEEGSVISCVTQVGGSADAWALGSPTAWLDTVIENDTAGLELGGDCRLATALLSDLHGALFGAESSRFAIRP